ncbi:MAG: O-phosphoserine--tRNA ligase [Candidatus Hadarchaeales archaeon]
MPFDVGKLRELAEKDFRKAWEESANLVRKSGRVFELQPSGKPNPLFELVQRFRQALIRLGFREMIVPIIVDKREVYKQYGSEAPIILDRVFFLATLERPDIGIGKKKIEEIRSFLPSFNKVEKLQEIFRRYKLGEIPADDLIETISSELSISDAEAEKILSLFSELRDLKPVPGDLTLRSHTTAGWFGILAELYRRESLPIQLFHVGPKFRREQRLDETHLYESWTASVVVMAKEITLEDGMEITRRIFAEVGYPRVEMKIKKSTSRYYAPGTEFEVFLEHKSGPVEVGDGGLYSPVALANYGIPYPVFNLGIGLERLLMIETGETDIRRLVYPYLYTPVVLSDEEIAKMIHMVEIPKTEVGRKIAENLFEIAKKYADAPSPCGFLVFEGEIGGRRVSVKLVEPEENKKLVGPAGFNEIFVYDGNIIAVPPTGWEEKEFVRVVREKGISTGIKFMSAFANLVGRRAEEAVESGEKMVEVQIKNVKLPSDINLEIEEPARNFITSNKKRVDVRGPFFTTAVIEVE